MSEHIKHIFEEGELEENSVVRKFRTTASDGKSYNTTYYNLDMIIALGYRIKSVIATRFRQWATQRLKEYMIKGFTLDDERLKKLGGGGYWKELLERIRDIRATEKVFYRQVLEIYATSIDYDPRASVSQEFFKKVQNKIHYAVHGHTAAELIVERADAEKDFMGLLTFKGTQPTLAEAKTAKNYLDEKELRAMGQLVSGYLDFAERQAEREQPMTMSDWANYLDRILTMSGEQLLQDSGKVSHTEAMEHATNEYRKYKQRTISDVEQDYLDAIRMLDNLKKIRIRMKLKYKHQRFQADAAKSVTDIFTGQQYCDSADFLIDLGKNKGVFDLTGFGNQKLMLDRESITENLRQIQMNWGLKPVEYLQGDISNPMFTIEMETGTGKTYTYIKTMYELNKLYGWNKFIIVVPSIAIREGVQKSFETMQEHFATEYGKRIQFFVYNSKQLSKIDSFASDSGLHVMIINTQAFNSSMNEDKNQEGRSGDAAARIIFSRRDEFGSRRPIDILAQTNPIMIIDEPQSVLGAKKDNATRKGIAKFHPLFTLLYSATHRKDDVYNMVYRLDAMDAYNRKLVKKIEVKGISQLGSTATNGFVYLDEIVIGKGNPQARISFDVKTANGFKQTTRLVGEGFNLLNKAVNWLNTIIISLLNALTV